MKIRYPITFLYYTDLEPVIPFYRDVLGLSLAMDQGWCKILAVSPLGFVGLVDERYGSLDATDDKGVLLTLVVDDVDAWHSHLEQAGAPGLTEPTLHDDIGVYCFFCEDPGGYRIEIQKFIDHDIAGA